jgi:Protein of unknown function (DUF3000)
VSSVTPAFDAAVAAIRGIRLRPELEWQEAPAPTRVAPHSLAITADVVVGDAELATGRLVLLHDPAGHEAWQGTFRFVAYARADMDAEMVGDPLLGRVAWEWLTEALAGRGALYRAASGTVTRVSSEPFGGMADDPARAELEIRASWTPESADGSGTVDVVPHVHAWGDLLAVSAGLPSLPTGVAQIRRGARR